MALHRRDNWLVSVAGEYKFRDSHEGKPSYIAAAFNHYTKNGSVFVVSTGNPPSPWDSGFSMEGWDSRHIPGTTSYLGETEKELQQRHNCSKSAFAAGTDLDGDGIWGMEFIHESGRKTDNICFNKSAFCFGDRVTLITTGIRRGPYAKQVERTLPFVTTLFQNAFGGGGITKETKEQTQHFGIGAPKKPAPPAPEQEPFWLNGTEIKAFPFAQTLPGGSVRCVVDNKHTGYYIPAEAPPLQVTRREQKWNFIWNGWGINGARYPDTNPDHYTPSVGNFATAWFKQGVKPDYSECVYTLIPESTPESMEKFAKDMADPTDPPYRILEKSEKAHILRDRDSKTTGYVLFDKSWFSQSQIFNQKSTILLSVNRPCSVMVKDAGGKLRLSVASTDMDDWPHWGGGKISLSGEIILTVAGEWAVEGTGVTVGYEKGQTVLRISYRTFMPIILTLKPLKV